VRKRLNFTGSAKKKEVPEVILDIYQPDGIGEEETMKRNEGISGVIIFAEVESN
jgi:hypothetical protein